MPSLTLVRHGRPAIEPSVPAWRWELAPDAADEVGAIGPIGPPQARWFSSPEPKALATAQLLAPRPVQVVQDLREAERTAAWHDEPSQFHALVRGAFESPETPVLPGWEPLAHVRERVVAAVRGLLDPVLPTVAVGHGTAWTLLVAALTGAEPDVDAWRVMGLPAVADLDVDGSGTARLVRPWRA